VEDDDAHAKLVLLAMSENQISNPMDRVCDGEAALAFVRREGIYADCLQPNIILLDLNLPKIDGHEVLKQLKADETLRHIPVVIMTTSVSEADKIKAYYGYANSYLVKPVGLEQFRQMIKALNLYWAVWNEPCSS
jgi:CheY-like chemotaxis protein